VEFGTPINLSYGAVFYCSTIRAWHSYTGSYEHMGSNWVVGVGRKITRTVRGVRLKIMLGVRRSGQQGGVGEQRYRNQSEWALRHGGPPEKDKRELQYNAVSISLAASSVRPGRPWPSMKALGQHIYG
jgi:hypothetical protein